MFFPIFDRGPSDAEILGNRDAKTGEFLPYQGVMVNGVAVNEFSRSKIDATVNELKEEKSLVAELLPK